MPEFPYGLDEAGYDRYLDARDDPPGHYEYDDPPAPGEQVYCPECGQRIGADEVPCPYCGARP